MMREILRSTAGNRAVEGTSLDGLEGAVQEKVKPRKKDVSDKNGGFQETYRKTFVSIAVLVGGSVAISRDKAIEPHQRVGGLEARAAKTTVTQGPGVISSTRKG